MNERTRGDEDQHSLLESREITKDQRLDFDTDRIGNWP